MIRNFICLVIFFGSAMYSDSITQVTLGGLHLDVSEIEITQREVDLCSTGESLQKLVRSLKTDEDVKWLEKIVSYGRLRVKRPCLGSKQANDATMFTTFLIFRACQILKNFYTQKNATVKIRKLQKDLLFFKKWIVEYIDFATCYTPDGVDSEMVELGAFESAALFDKDTRDELLIFYGKNPKFASRLRQWGQYVEWEGGLIISQ